MAVSKKKRKKQTQRKSKRARKGKESTEKGGLLEQIAARMYGSPFHKVTPNAKLPPINRNPKRKREIDVLLEGKVVTRPAQRAIECKNLGKKVGVGKIDEFIGKLADVGIPHEHGIYISPTGYTADAVDRASFDAALKIEPEEVGTLHSKGLALYRLGRFDEALEIYDRVLTLSSDAYDTLANKALVLAELGRSDEAIETASRALNLVPETSDRSMLFAIRAKISYGMSRFGDVVADMVEAWKLNPNLILSLRESHAIFVQSFNALPSVTEEGSKLYAVLSKKQKKGA